MYRWSERSYRKLQGVRPELVAVATLALRRLGENGGPDFVVTSGKRTEEEQRELVNEGASQTMNSRHVTGHAIDIAAFDEKYNVTWEGRYYQNIADFMFEAAEDLGVKIEWGGNWQEFRDMPHFALDWEAYPA